MKKILAFALALAMILTCSLALADRLDDIKAAGKLTVATSPDWPPYEYIDDNGDFTGIDVEIAHEACGRMNIQPVFKKIVWQNWRKAVTQSYRDCKMSASCS